jgi:hypothetical protein
VAKRPPRKPTAKRLPRSHVEIADADRHKGGSVSLAQEKQARDLLDRLRAVVPVPHETRDRRDLILSQEDAWAVLLAAEKYVDWIDGIRLEARAFKAAQAASPSRRFEAYAKARGIHGPGFESNRPRNGAAVVATYLLLLGYDGPVPSVIGSPIWETTAGATNVDEWFEVPEAPLTPKQAVEVTAQVHRFASVGACRKFLFDQRAEIQRRRSGWRLHFPTDFKVPHIR